MHTTRLKRMIFCVTATGNFAAMLNASSVNIALYKISQTFNVSVMQVQWVVLSYMIILTGLLTFFGRMGDMVDKRKLYAAGFALFGVGSVLSYFSGGFATLIASRAVQAVGGAILIANSFSIVSAVFKGKSRGRALGFLGAATHLAAMTAPSLSGLLMNFFKWQSIFVPNIAISFAGLFLALRFIPKSYGRAQMRADYGGTVLLVGGVAVLLLMIAQVPVWSWNSKETALCLGALIILFVLFGMRESAAKFPLIDFSLFSNRAFLFSNFALGISYLAMGGNTILFPFYAQQVLEKTPFITGVMIFPFSCCYLITAVSTGGLDARKRMLTGLFMMVLCLLAFSSANARTPVWFLILVQGMMGAGNALFQPSVNLSVLNAAPKKDVGMASGILSLFRNTGIAAGGVVAVSLFEAKQAQTAAILPATESFLSGYRFSMVFGAFFGVLCFLLIYFSNKQKNPPVIVEKRDG